MAIGRKAEVVFNKFSSLSPARRCDAWWIALSSMLVVISSCRKHESSASSSPTPELPVSGTELQEKSSPAAEPQGVSKEAPNTDAPSLQARQALRKLQSQLSNVKEFNSVAEEHARQASASFHVVESTPPGEPVVWNAVTLNQEGMHLDGIRFRSPLETPANMHMLLAFPTSSPSWHLVSPETQQLELHYGSGTLGSGFDALQLPPLSAIYSCAIGDRSVLPEEDYLLLFILDENRPAEIFVAFQISDTVDHSRTPQIAQIAKSLNVSVLPPSYDYSWPSPEQAFRVGSKLVAWKWAGGQEYRKTVYSMRDVLPELDVTVSGETPRWNELNPLHSYRFNACKLKSPLDVAAEVYLVIASAEVIPDLTVASGEDNFQGAFAEAVGRNVTIEEADLPEANYVKYIRSFRWNVQPGEDVVLSFHFTEGILPEMKICACFVPASEMPRVLEREHLVQSLGMKIRPPDQDQRHGILTECLEILETRPKERDQVASLLYGIESSLPELVLSDEGVVWNKVILDSTVHPLTAYRIKPQEGWNRFLEVVTRRSSKVSVTTYAAELDYEQLGERLDAGEFPTGRESSDDEIYQFQSFSLSNYPQKPRILLFDCRHPEPVSLEVAAKYQEPTAFRRMNQRALAKPFNIEIPYKEPPQGFELLDGHLDQFNSIEYSRDGQTLLTNSRDGRIQVWDATSYERIHNWDTEWFHQDVRLTSDGTHFVSYNEGSVSLWNIEDGSHEILLQNDLRKSACCSRAGNKVFVATESNPWTEGELYIWDLPNLEPVQRVGLGKFEALDLVASPDGSRVFLVGTLDGDPIGRNNSVGAIRVFDTQTCEIIRKDQENYGPWNRVAISEDGSHLILNSNWQVLCTKDTDSLATIQEVIQDQSISSLSDPQQGYFATTLSNGVVRFWRSDPLGMVGDWEEASVNRVAFSPDGQTVAFGTKGGEAYVANDKRILTFFDFSDKHRPLTDELGIQFRAIPAGEFQMGWAPGPQSHGWVQTQERPSHLVRIDRPFYISAHEITVAQFRQFVQKTNYITTAEKNASETELFYPQGSVRKQPGATWENPGFPQSDQHPVTFVSWDDAVAFCQWCSEVQGEVYRLPTEAEWEYAARAGSRGNWYFGGDVDLMTQTANVQMIDDNDLFYFTSPVGSFLPNANGLYDVYGNVFEWCHDWYSESYYNVSEVVAPTGPEAGESRCQRGGCYAYGSSRNRSSYRDGGPPHQTQSVVGFRVVREIRP